MTKTKGRRTRRRGSHRKLRPTATPGSRLGTHQYQRANGRCKNFKVRFERLGQYYDDVLFTLEYDKRAVAAIRALPQWARYWDATSNVWRIHPGYSERLAVDLRHFGYTVYGQSAQKA
jgi:hypothetical protein